MDIYEPNLLPGEPSTTKFPLVIVCHGAGTSRVNTPWTSESIAIEMAKRGFVTCFIDYRNDFELVMSENLGLFFFDYWLSFFPDSTMSCNEDLNKKYLEKVFYTNAMDVQNAITYMVNNQSLYRVNTNKVVVGGHSQGGMAANYCLYVDKDEMIQNFPSTFMTDNRYIDLNLHRNRLGAGFSFAGSITDVNYIDADEKTPIFMVHGTHDASSPYHSGNQLCDLFSNMPNFYGSAAMAEKLDAFSDNLGFSYYLVQLNGIGHSPFVTAGNLGSSFTKDFWQNDFFRYLYNVLFPPSGVYPKNQIHKVVTPINPILNYCNSNYVEKGFYAFSNSTNNSLNNFTTKCGQQYSECLSLYTPNLTTKPWVDNLPNFCTNLLPLVNFNTNSNNTCELPFNNYCETISDGALINPFIVTLCINGNYSFLRQSKENENSILLNNNFKIYPNPTSNFINIQSSTDEKIENITIVSALGQIVYQTNYDDAEKQKVTIDISNIANGNYIIRIGTDRDIYTKKIIKQN
jgi:predicted esterase